MSISFCFWALERSQEEKEKKNEANASSRFLLPVAIYFNSDLWQGFTPREGATYLRINCALPPQGQTVDLFCLPPDLYIILTLG